MPPKNSLGKGLGAMFPDLIDAIGTKPSFILCGIEELVPNRFQSRKAFDDREQKRLVASIRKSGIIQPLVVRKVARGYEIIVGERRWRAAQEAKLREVPVIIRDAEDLEVAELSLVENIQREALNPIEEAEAYQILSGTFGLSQEEISARVGKDRSTVANMIRLLKAPPEVRAALIDKSISPGHARALLALNSPEEQRRALETIVVRGLNVRETENLISKRMDVPHEQKAPPRDPYLLDLERDLSSTLMAKVQIRQGKKSGQIEIRFSTKEELNRIITLLREISGS